MRKDGDWLLPALAPPGVELLCIYGTGKQTAGRLTYNGEPVSRHAADDFVGGWRRDGEHTQSARLPTLRRSPSARRWQRCQWPTRTTWRCSTRVPWSRSCATSCTISLSPTPILAELVLCARALAIFALALCSSFASSLEGFALSLFILLYTVLVFVIYALLVLYCTHVISAFNRSSLSSTVLYTLSLFRSSLSLPVQSHSCSNSYFTCTLAFTQSITKLIYEYSISSCN